MIYLLYDTALNGPYTLMLLQNAYPDNQSLFKGTKDEMLSDVAPYLFCVDEHLFEKVNDPASSMQALVVFESAERTAGLLMHFQQFIYQKINGQENYFRFWDARVLSRFLPACDDKKLLDLFDGITAFYCPDKKNERAEKHMIKRGKLQTMDSALSELFVLGNAGQLELQDGDPVPNEEHKKTKRKFF
ncbi:MAG: DUF4123 domain-containing protein [Ferruginibacter sp.]